MAGDTVTTIFGGDDSNFQAAARKVKEAVSGLAALGGSMKFFENAQKGAKGLHDSTQLAEQGVKSLTAAFAPLIAMGAALVGVGTVFAGIKKSIELAAKTETIEFHLAAVAGGGDKAAASIKRLHEIAHETGSGFGTLAEGSIRLQEAGQSALEAAESMGKLQKIALNSGSDVNELGEIYARVLTKADVSAKDLVKLAMTGIPGIGAIAQKFKDAERNTASWDLEIDKTIQNLNRMYEQAEKQTSSVNSFGGKIGLMQASFAAWARTGGNAISGLVKSIDGVNEAGIGSMSGTFGKQFTEGLKQIETETGLSGQALQRFMVEGKMGYEDLIAAAGRFREEAHKQADADLEKQKLENQNDLLKKQRGLLDEVRGAIETATKPGGIFGSVEKFFETFNGKMERMHHAIDGVFKTFGAPLIDALKPALDEITNFFAGPGKAALADWGATFGGWIKDAMQGLQHGNWGPLQKDGVTAFAAILGAATKGFEYLGVILRDVFSGSETLGTVMAFGVVLKDVLSIAVDSIFKKLTTIHIGMSEEDIAKFDKAQEAADAQKSPSASMAKLSDDLATLVTKAGTLGSKVGEGLSRQSEHRPAGMDQATWDAYYAPISSIAGPKAAEPAAPEPAAESNGQGATPATAATSSPVAQIAAATAPTAAEIEDQNPIASSTPIFGPSGIPTGVTEVLKPSHASQQAAAGSGFTGFSVPLAPAKTGAVKSPIGNFSQPAKGGPSENSINGTAVSYEAAQNALRENRFAHHIDPFTASNPSIDYAAASPFSGASAGVNSPSFAAPGAASQGSVTTAPPQASAPDKGSGGGDADKVTQALQKVITLLTAIAGADSQLVHVFTS